MIEQGPIEYNHELSTLIDLVKSGTPEGERVTNVLRSGDEEGIRHMLKNFGNPEIKEWQDITSASPWTDWQIDRAVADLEMIRPYDVEITAIKYWGW